MWITCLSREVIKARIMTPILREEAVDTMQVQDEEVEVIIIGEVTMEVTMVVVDEVEVMMTGVRGQESILTDLQTESGRWTPDHPRAGTV